MFVIKNKSGNEIILKISETAYKGFETPKAWYLEAWICGFFHKSKNKYFETEGEIPVSMRIDKKTLKTSIKPIKFYEQAKKENENSLREFPVSQIDFLFN